MLKTAEVLRCQMTAKNFKVVLAAQIHNILHVEQRPPIGAPHDGGKLPSPLPEGAYEAFPDDSPNQVYTRSSLTTTFSHTLDPGHSITGTPAVRHSHTALKGADVGLPSL